MAYDIFDDIQLMFNIWIYGSYIINHIYIYIYIWIYATFSTNVFSTLGYLSPVLAQEVVLVLPPESVHRRNLASRRASDAAKEKVVGNEPPLGHQWGGNPEVKHKTI